MGEQEGQQKVLKQKEEPQVVEHPGSRLKTSSPSGKDFNMNIVTQGVKLHADEWTAHAVAELAVHALRQPGGISHIAELSVSSYRPCDRSRIWLIEDDQGNILAEQPSLYNAIHTLCQQGV